MARFQGPKGTRDLYPADMAWWRYVTEAWRRVSIRHGFEEIEGPTFEFLDLYRVKSGEEIVSELFSFEDRGGREFALRPEFTPTLARMVAARAGSLPLPVKWFSLPAQFRAERPQRGRLRQFTMWNVDLIGGESPDADVEVLAVAIDLLSELGLTRELVRVRVSHRQVITRILLELGVSEQSMGAALAVIDKREKISAEAFRTEAAGLGLTRASLDQLEEISQVSITADHNWPEILERMPECATDIAELEQLHRVIQQMGLDGWCELDLGVVRGLAYYTGMVFEIRDAAGSERAVAGGGRYDQLIESFGGPALPACGFGMGDAVLGLLLADNGLKPDDDSLLPAADVFVISLGSDAAGELLPGFVYDLRRAGLHARRSYRSTRNLGKLLKEASAARSRFAVILGDELQRGTVAIKDLETGDQFELPAGKVAEALLIRLGRFGVRGLE